MRYTLASSQVRSSFEIQPDHSGDKGTFALTLVPPVAETSTRPARDIVLLLNCSGSMSFSKMVCARRTCIRLVELLQEQDRFVVYTFNNHIFTALGFEKGLMPATYVQRKKAIQFLEKIFANAGTEIFPALQRAVVQLTKVNNSLDTRNKHIILITDGQVANERQIVRELGNHLKPIRLH
ncbi:MAG TPA: VWA domain-containing protein, partial [Gemmatales bacterium]|nr:VWA domain-containing protein [Gemmatales bacterium]